MLKFLIREPIKQKSIKRWWLVYGPPRTGTTYITNLISNRSKLYLSDWGLGYILRLVPDHDYIKFDRERFLKDVSNNVIDNAYMGRGKKLESILGRTQYLDLVFKQANLDFEKYNMLIKMWGEPERKIFCLREPAGFISSARKKFPQQTLSQNQSKYINCLKSYEQIGGDIIEYNANLEIEDYLLFLKPLELSKDSLQKFNYQGSDERESFSEEMRSAYQDFKEKNVLKIFNKFKI